MSLAGTLASERPTSPRIPARFFICALFGRSGLKCELDADQKGFLILCGNRPGRGAAAVEAGLFVVKVQFHISVQIPVQADAKGKRASGRTAGGVKREDVAIDRQLANPSHDLPCPPAVAS